MAITGTGSESDPWIINNVTDLTTYAATSSYWGSGTYTELGADIDLKDTTWSTMIGTSSSATYSGNFDGKNHIISNLEYTNKPLFGYAAGCTIKNIIMEGCSCEATSAYGTWSPFCSIEYNGATIDNCHIRNSSYTNVNDSSKQSGFFAYSISSSTISNCTVENCTANTIGMFGGITAQVYGSGVVDNCSIIGCNFTINYTRDSSYSQAALVSKCEDTSVITNCNCEDTILTITWGGACICGGLLDTTSMSNCTVTNCTINSTTNVRAGIACGTAATGASITNVHVKSCRVTSTQSSVGGLISYANCAISKCSVRDCYLSGYYDSGAFTSGSYGGSISDCYCDNCTLVSTVPSASQYFTYCSGGFIDSVAGDITISNCYASNITHTANSFVKCGGFVGDARSSATITDCCCYGGNYGDTFVGNGSGATMTNCKTSADISESDYHTRSWWQDTMEFDFDDTWVWNIVAGLPRFTSGGSLSKLYLKLFGTWVTMGTDE